MFNKNKARTKGLKKTSTHVNTLRQFERLRFVKDGYPLQERIFTKKEVLEYFSQDTITCLLCGNEFQAIRPHHMSKIHNKSLDEYRDLYGLPYSKGLLSKTSYEKQRDRFAKMREEGVIVYDPEQTKMAHDAVRSGGSRTSKCRFENARSQSKKANEIGAKKRTIPDLVIKQVNDMREKGWKLQDAVDEVGISRSAYHSHMQK